MEEFGNFGDSNQESNTLNFGEDGDDAYASQGPDPFAGAGGM